MVSPKVTRAQELVSMELAKIADPGKAPRMQAYMKTEMPFYGVQKVGRVPILRRVAADFPPVSADDYQRLVLGLWALPHREEKYIALGFARRFTGYVVPARLPLYRRLIVEGAWWDFVDEVATKLVGRLVVEYPESAWPVVDGWIEESDMWLRRAALICQVGAGSSTDAGHLFRFSLQRAHEKEFFIRKAIGWALREYSKTDPESVGEFINANADRLSGLSFREGSRHIRGLVDSRG